MSENLIASLLVGRNNSSNMPIEEYKARKVALVTGKFLFAFCVPFFFLVTKGTKLL